MYVCKKVSSEKRVIINIAYNLLRDLGLVKVRFLSIYVYVLCHLVYLILGISSNVVAQISTFSNNIEKGLIDEGFENVGVFSSNDTLSVFYENRRYRFEPHGLSQVIRIANKFQQSQDNTLRVVVLKDRVPHLEIFLATGSYRNYIIGRIDAIDFSNQISVSMDFADKSSYTSFRNSSLFKVDIPVIPTWSAKFGNFHNPVESNINLIPELNSTFGKGLTFKAQLIIPIQNDFYFVSERETIRPGNITLNQFLKLEDNFYINITVGTFNKNRAGFNFEVKKLFQEDDFGVGANVGYTTYYSFTGIETEFYDKQKYLTAILTSEYWYNPYDLTIRLDVGYFLFNVLAARFEIVRQFGEVKIGFFAFTTKDEYDGGFRFTIPIPPRKYTRLTWLRLRPSDSFNWEYRAKGFPQNGVTYNTGYNLNDELMDYNPDFIKKQLIIEINKTLLN